MYGMVLYGERARDLRTRQILNISKLHFVQRNMFCARLQSVPFYVKKFCTLEREQIKLVEPTQVFDIIKVKT